MHKSLRHSTRLYFPLWCQRARLLKDFGRRIFAACDGVQKTHCQCEDENPKVPGKELSTKMSMKVELKSEEDETEVNED